MTFALDRLFFLGLIFINDPHPVELRIVDTIFNAELLHIVPIMTRWPSTHANKSSKFICEAHLKRWTKCCTKFQDTIIKSRPFMCQQPYLQIGGWEERLDLGDCPSPPLHPLPISQLRQITAPVFLHVFPCLTSSTPRLPTTDPFLLFLVGDRGSLGEDCR